MNFLVEHLLNNYNPWIIFFLRLLLLALTLGTVANNKFWSSMSFQNLVRLSQISKMFLPDYAHVNKVSKN
jgi:hypothetical protein